MGYDDLKNHDGSIYTGMSVGGFHDWKYAHGRWQERKLAPDRWTFEFRSPKIRRREAPPGSGAATSTGYHWYILADQHVRKIDKDTYDTLMTGLKFKVGHRRPRWNRWSYDYPRQKSCRERVLEILKDTVRELEGK